MLRVLFGRTVSVGLARRIYEEIEIFGASRPMKERPMIGLVSEGSAVRGLLVENVAHDEIAALSDHVCAFALKQGLTSCVVEEVTEVK